jgi:hypothetical protein
MNVSEIASEEKWSERYMRRVVSSQSRTCQRLSCELYRSRVTRAITPSESLTTKIRALM